MDTGRGTTLAGTMAGSLARAARNFVAKGEVRFPFHLLTGLASRVQWDSGASAGSAMAAWMGSALGALRPPRIDNSPPGFPGREPWRRAFFPRPLHPDSASAVHLPHIRTGRRPLPGAARARNRAPRLH